MHFLTPELDQLEPSTLDDASLVQVVRDLAEAKRTLESCEARVAAEVARRSSRDLGYRGLAARLGARSAEQLLQSLGRSSLPEARRLVRVGALVESDAESAPWLKPAIGCDVPSLDAIRIGLGMPSASIGPDALAEAAATLAAEAPSLDVDALARRARQMRDDLDLGAVPLREEERRQQRYLRLTPLVTGMTRISGLLDPESAAIVLSAVDTITAPRRGGPHFVESKDEEKPATIDDHRTIGQLMVDALVDVVAVAMKAPSGKLFGTKQPGVRVLVADRDLTSGVGAGYLEGQADPVSIATVERYLCAGGVVPLLFDKRGQGIDEGRHERFHTPKQRRLIAARDGECIAPGCAAPPGWCEVHHIVPWAEGGGTSVEDGVLVCRFHHMMMHNNGWRVVRSDADYALHPPATFDPDRTPVHVLRGSRARDRLALV